MLVLSNNHFSQIRTLGLDGRPNEVCGLLAGTALGARDGAQVLSARSIYPIDNVDRSPVTFRMDPRQQFQAEKAIDNRGLQTVGIFHTHPASPAYPSETDVARAHWEDSTELLFPEAIFLILSLQDAARPDFRAFKIQGRRVPDDLQEIPIVLTSRFHQSVPAEIDANPG